MFPKKQKDFLWRLNDELPVYLQRLALSSQVGRFLPCETGATELGKALALGYSCFAMKTYFMLGWWDKLERSEQTEWFRFIKSYQIQGQIKGDEVTHNAFIDRPLYDFLEPKISWRQRLRQALRPELKSLFQQAVVIAETKQAIATLSEVGGKPDVPYLGFRQTAEKLQGFLSSLDWTKPWGAGGQASAQVVFVKTQAPIALGAAKARELAQVCDHWFQERSDPETGLYFLGNTRPQYGEAVNGAMKVLTALDWLETPVHYPARLIDTCLSEFPSAEGCHVVDAVYVLYRCLQFTSHRKQEIQAYCASILDMICQHHNQDGGFSYFVGRSQTTYYGAPITTGLSESDIHGTVLLTWALAMILQIMEDNFLNWRAIRP